MARAAAASDIYNAIAEPRRRAIFEFVCEGERSVTDVVSALNIGQPSVSKHLRVLREVDLVTVRRDGRKRLYAGDVQTLGQVRDWVRQCERLWERQLDRIKERAERRAATPPGA